jgi:hypothetical protein
MKKGATSSSPQCSVCKDSVAKYNCPRCNIVYCSIACYQRHGTECTESFYREQVLSTAKGQSERGSHEQRKLVAEMLLRNREGMEFGEDVLAALKDEANGKQVIDFARANNDDDDDDETDETHDDFDNFEKALQYISNGDVEAGLACLSEQQRKDFDAALYDGTLSSLIRAWTPWWVSVPIPPTVIADKCTGSLVQEVAGDTQADKDDDDEASIGVLPTLPETIPPLQQFTKKEPSPLLAFNLLDILFAYVNTMRHYNGEPSVEPLAAAWRAVQLSAVLCDNAVHASIDTALQSCAERVRRVEIGIPGGVRSSSSDESAAAAPLLSSDQHKAAAAASTSQSSIGVAIEAAWHDVSRVLACRRFAAAALTDLHANIERALLHDAQPSAQRAPLAAAARKLRFFQAWLADLAPPQLAALQRRVDAFIASRAAAKPAPASPDVDAAPAAASSLIQSLLFESTNITPTTTAKTTSKQSLIQEI